jgi:hypothetical protein
MLTTIEKVMRMILIKTIRNSTWELMMMARYGLVDHDQKKLQEWINDDQLDNE